MAELCLCHKLYFLFFSPFFLFLALMVFNQKKKRGLCILSCSDKRMCMSHLKADCLLRSDLSILSGSISLCSEYSLPAASYHQHWINQESD